MEWNVREVGSSILLFPVILRSITLSIKFINFIFILLNFTLVAMVVLIVLVALFFPVEASKFHFYFVEKCTHTFFIINIMSINSIFQRNMFLFMSLHQIELAKKRERAMRPFSV